MLTASLTHISDVHPDLDGAVAPVGDVEGVVQVLGRDGVDAEHTVAAVVPPEPSFMTTTKHTGRQARAGG